MAERRGSVDQEGSGGIDLPSGPSQPVYLADCFLFKRSEWRFNDERCDAGGHPERRVAVSEDAIIRRVKKSFNHGQALESNAPRLVTHRLKLNRCLNRHIRRLSVEVLSFKTM